MIILDSPPAPCAIRKEPHIGMEAKAFIESEGLMKSPKSPQKALINRLIKVTVPIIIWASIAIFALSIWMLLHHP